MDKIQSWANAHIFYDFYLNPPAGDNHLINKEEIKWRERLVNHTPNGSLLINNSFFNILKNSNSIYLAHITYNLEKILEEGFLYPSGGCLVGSIYCVPLFLDKEGLRLHNLGIYLYQFEAPVIKKNHQEPQILIINLTLPKNKYFRNLIGINYLKLGKIHWEVYEEMKYLLSFSERTELEKIIVSRVKSSMSFLNLSREFWLKRKFDASIFFQSFLHASNYLPILGYLYFEAVSEYLMLHQDNKNAIFYKNIKEPYTHTYKDLMYHFYPEFLQNFRLSSFKPKPEKLFSYIKKKKIITNFDPSHMLNYLAERLLFWVNTLLLNCDLKVFNLTSTKWELPYLCKFCCPLIGHLIHRELRIFRRYPHFYFYFDQHKALQAWNYWNNFDIIIPFNGVFPKGEVGINPAFPNLKYKIFRGGVYKREGIIYVKPKSELSVKIVPKLVDLKLTIMRNKPKMNKI